MVDKEQADGVTIRAALGARVGRKKGTARDGRDRACVITGTQRVEPPKHQAHSACCSPFIKRKFDA
jgi:hypothetical protein